MANTYWRKQTADKPLFPDVLWSRPQNKRQAGKLLIIGGNAHGFAAPAEAYAAAEQSGVGTARVLLPDVLQKTVGRVFPEAEFVPSTPSGSFSQKALAEVLDAANWADGALLAGDFGKNSETAVMLEAFARNYTGQLTITGDSLDYFKYGPESLLNRQQTLIVAAAERLQQLAMAVHFQEALTSTMDLLRLVEALHKFTEQFAANLTVRHLENIIVASSGQVSTTVLKHTAAPWLVRTAAHASVWWLQNPTKTFESITASTYVQNSADGIK